VIHNLPMTKQNKILVAGRVSNTIGSLIR